MFPELDEPECLPAFRFIDLFAGIGGIHKGLEAAGGTCVYAVESDKFALQTYNANFTERRPGGTRRQIPRRDIYEVKVTDFPAYDVLAAGFPCQPFSIAGVSKKLSLGRAHGFEDRKSGNLFFEIIRLIDEAPTPSTGLRGWKDSGRVFETVSIKGVERTASAISMNDAREPAPALGRSKSCRGVASRYGPHVRPRHLPRTLRSRVGTDA